MTESASAPAKKPSKAATAPRKQRSFWRGLWRWTKRIVVVGLILLVLGRLTLQFWLPSALNAAAEGAGVRIEYEDFDLSLVSGDVELRHVDLYDAAHGDAEAAKAAGAEPFLHVEFARLDVDTSGLFYLDLRVHRVEADGIDIELERDADGRWILPQPAASASESAEVVEAEPAPEDASDDAPAPWDLSLPLQLDAVRAQHVRVHLVDAVHELDTWFEAHVRISDLGHPERRTRISLQLLGEDALDALTVEAHMTTVPTQFEMDFDCGLRGLHLSPCQGLLREFGIAPVARSLDAGARGRVVVHSAEAHPELNVEASIERVALTADGKIAAAVDTVEVRAKVTPDRAVVESVEVDGVRAHAERRADGTLRFAGLDLVEAESAAAGSPSDSQVAASPESSSPAAAPSETPSWGVDKVEVTGVEIAFEDHAVAPPTTLRPSVRSLLVENLGPGREATMAIDGGLAPASDSWTVGGVLALEDDGGVRARIDVASGIDFTGLDPWLRPAGLVGVASESTLAMRLECAMTNNDAGVGVEVSMTGLALGAGEEELFAIDEMRASASLAASEGRVSSAMIGGLRVPLRLDDAGSVHVFGLRTQTREERRDAPVAPSSDAPASAPPPPSKSATGAKAADEPHTAWFLDQVDVQNSSLRIVDAHRSDRPEQELLFDLGVAMRGIAIGQEDERDATVDVTVGCQKVGAVAVSAAVHLRPGPLDLDVTVDVTGDRLDITHLEGFLTEAGITPTLTEGTLRARVEASVVDDADQLRASVRFADVALLRGDTELVALDELAVPAVTVRHADGALDVEPVRVAGVRAAVRMDEAGVLHAAGIALAAAESSPPPAAPPRPASAGEAPPSAEAPVAVDSAPPTAPIRIGGLQLVDVAIDWRDEAISAEDPVTTVLRARGDVGAVVLGGSSDGSDQPVAVDFHVGVDEALEDLQVRGTLGLSPVSPRVDLEVASMGLRGDGVLQRYLAPGQSVLLRDGRLALRLKAAVDPVEAEGGIVVAATVEEITLRDGADGDVLMGVRELGFEASRIDPDGGQITIDRLVARGMRVGAIQRDGGWEFAGFRVEPPPVAETQNQPEPPPEDSASAEESLAVIDPNAAPAAPPPTIELRQLEVELESFWLHEAGAAPLATSLSLSNVEPLFVLGPDPEELPPLRLELAAQAVGEGAGAAMESLRIAIDARPWQFDPSLDIDVQLSGLHGAPLQAALPETTASVDLSGIDGGSVRAKFHARLELRRRDPTEFDLSRGFGLEMELTDIEYRATDGGELLAGVQSVYLGAPKLGAPSGNVHVTEFAVQGITGRVEKTAEGLKVLGILIPAADDAAPAPAEDAEPVAVSEAPTAPEGEVEEGPSPLIRVDRVDVHGLDFVVTDTSLDPPLRLPLDELSVSVEGLRVGGDEPPPVARFEVLLGTNTVELPVRKKASSALAGFLGAAGKALAGAADDVEFEERPLLGELVVKGAVAPSSPPKGVVAVDLSRLELLGLRGAAKAAGVEISDGVFDADIDVKLDESGATNTDAVFTFADLGLDEPPGGPISTYLKLPAPLQTVLFALKNSDDEIIAPLSVETDSEGGVSTAAIAGSAVNALGAIIGDALASSALRVGGAVTGLFGFGGPSELPAEANVMLAFEPGSADLPAEAQAQLSTLLEVLGDEELEVVALPVIGLRDLERAAVFANPEDRDRSALVERLRGKKRRLWRRRDVLSNELRVCQSLADAERVAGLRGRVREVESDLAVTERALDSVLSLARPGAEKGADRRARRLALQLVDARSEALIELFTRVGGPELAARVQLRRARFPESGDDGFARGFFALSPRRVSQ